MQRALHPRGSHANTTTKRRAVSSAGVADVTVTSRLVVSGASGGSATTVTYLDKDGKSSKYDPHVSRTDETDKTTSQAADSSDKRAVNIIDHKEAGASAAAAAVTVIASHVEVHSRCFSSHVEVHSRCFLWVGSSFPSTCVPCLTLCVSRSHTQIIEVETGWGVELPVSAGRNRLA